jgi:transcription elongation factor Elf1
MKQTTYIKPFQALREAREEGVLKMMDYWGQSNPRCPHCGEVYREQEASEVYDNGREQAELNCGSCGRAFIVQIAVKYRFFTDEADGGASAELCLQKSQGG